MPLSRINLDLLEQKLSSLGETPYFLGELKAFSRQLARVAQKTKLIARTPATIVAIDRITNQLWSATRYLDGSTTRLLPYEVVYCLELALKDWVVEKYLITTAILHEKNFYFLGIPDTFYTEANAFCGETFSSRLVQIALPDLYRHKPLFNFALYHELGHFVDAAKAVTKLALLMCPAGAIPDLGTGPSSQMSLDQYNQIRLSHLQEYFADLFAACYVGNAIKHFLNKFAANFPASMTHPATAERIKNIDDLLQAKPSPIIDLFQIVLLRLKLPKLEKRYDQVDVKSYFDNATPVSIRSDRELHGIFEAGGEYLDQALERKTQPWSIIPEEQIERVINDLTEKSIRTYMIQKRWADGTP